MGVKDKNPYRIDMSAPFAHMDNSDADFARESGWDEGYKAGIKEVVERGNGLLDRYSQSSVASFWMEVVSQSLMASPIKEMRDKSL